MFSAVAYVDATPYLHHPTHLVAVTDNPLPPTPTASVLLVLPATGILRCDAARSRPIQIISMAATATRPGKEAADSIAHDSNNRASPPLPGTRDAFLTHDGISLHYRLSRLIHRTNRFPSNTCGFSSHLSYSRPAPFHLGDVRAGLPLMWQLPR
ncbi:hypothetical protein HPB52_002021 [Rhipicephalus sanguineus]|uniref:Uncharacterized protein n=1 Tax=Rhipicephalus sanguineus TaxID=34632 RepID=A0A9D4SZI5_RHISA|nr:hypothetical protein HPB52_002021 [Rhipicephalus sanguineus]